MTGSRPELEVREACPMPPVPLQITAEMSNDAPIEKSPDPREWGRRLPMGPTCMCYLGMDL